ncbi:hypothetical protein K402DRAFT_451037 [Aulographum hederae CBS 113979]|uniref:EGF-like domain-containing protein n=1 Tax=Aulographum hederae CBS 113979 TaxID=1176131 RepID=A0A6G1HC39_9PEZI|nr:hypothetical protein K402DRAFT_451037 [Aulographum hederae CBS 113979]
MQLTNIFLTVFLTLTTMVPACTVNTGRCSVAGNGDNMIYSCYEGDNGAEETPTVNCGKGQCVCDSAHPGCYCATVE